MTSSAVFSQPKSDDEKQAPARTGQHHTHTHKSRRSILPSLVLENHYSLGEVGMLSKGTHDNFGEKHGWINTTDEGKKTERSFDR